MMSSAWIAIDFEKRYAYQEICHDSIVKWTWASTSVWMNYEVLSWMNYEVLKWSVTDASDLKVGASSSHGPNSRDLNDAIETWLI